MLKNLTLFLLLLFGFSAQASHIVGGEIYYDYLGNNNYKFYIVVYRDCASNGAAYDSPLPLSVFTANGTRISDHDVPFPGSTVLPIVFDNPCVTAPSGICTERAIYTITLNLPPSSTGYIVAYQRCCRGPNVTNLINPDDTGLTLQAFVPPAGGDHYINSSARFTNYPPLVICNNENLNFDHSATDADGDSLSYELVIPYAGASSFNPAPNPIPAPPYPLVTWSGGFNQAIPLGPGSTTTIDPVTGHLFVDANNLGLYVVGIRVNEWRDGIIINSVTRDFLFRVVNCNVQLSAIVATQENTPGFISYCQGLTFTFDNKSFGASSYYWDFGVAGITTDNSTAFEPTYTFPQPGTYHVMLVANPGWPCTDTTYMDLILENPFNVDFTFLDSTCFIDNTLSFHGQIINGPSSTQFNWNFGPNATPQTATTQNVSNVAFSSAQNNIVTLIGTYSVCADTISKPVFFYDKPVPQVGFQTNHECAGYTQTFTNNSQGSTSYFWDFGVPGINTDVSTAVSPTYTFPAAGTYPITLIATSGPNCADTLVQNITIYDPLYVSFTHNDSLCITDNSFNFTGNVSGPATTTYSWNFGPNATPSTATTLDVSNVIYNAAGTFPVTLTASFLDCSESMNSTVLIFPIPVAGFTISDELKCEPYPAQFINLSHYENPLLSFWDFGDGGTSTDTNPLHIYTSAGTYSVKLTVISSIGCIDTLTLLQQDFITIHPKPHSGFSIDKKETDICNSRVQFTDLSQGTLHITYFFDELHAASTDPNPAYTYFTDGMHRPMQIVFNQYGCSDTSFQSIAIEPFGVYVPNAFTPDGNEHNNDFYPKLGLTPVEWNLKIYNRWGELLYQSDDFEEHWDGTFNGIACKEDIYSYVIRYVSCAPYANAETITGHVSLLK
ncbi:PKD domain-containing protein [Fluviicola sp.]|jgi:gliding motility-associated-like protein|uniref:PKD domain-containing protein n=1 Tax=Fluviicola sp. TaxID=1917219 RepID=UPI00283A943F|nr:PKD domain-containing protein [Fluviicola sp.]